MRPAGDKIISGFCDPKSKIKEGRRIQQAVHPGLDPVRMQAPSPNGSGSRANEVEESPCRMSAEPSSAMFFPCPDSCSVCAAQLELVGQDPMDLLPFLQLSSAGGGVWESHLLLHRLHRSSETSPKQERWWRENSSWSRHSLLFWPLAVTLDDTSLAITHTHTVHKYGFRVKRRAGHIKPDQKLAFSRAGDYRAKLITEALHHHFSPFPSLLPLFLNISLPLHCPHPIFFSAFPQPTSLPLLEKSASHISKLAPRSFHLLPCFPQRKHTHSGTLQDISV